MRCLCLIHRAQRLTQGRGGDVEGIQDPGPEGSGMPTRTLDGIGQRPRIVNAGICFDARMPTWDWQTLRVLDP